MAVQCPHCGASVELNRRHGLAGALCPECHSVVPVVDEPGPSKAGTQPRIARPQRAEVRPTCRACGGARDRETRRCPGCGEPWVYRVGALSVEDEAAHTRLVEYVLHRQSSAVSRERLAERYRRFPAAVLGGLTEAQAIRARHELENIGVQVALEEDDTATANAARRDYRFGWSWVVVPALVLFAVGVYLLVQSERTSRAEATARAAAPTPPASSAPESRPSDAPQDVLNGVALVETDGRRGFGVVVDRDGWFVAALSLVDRAGGVTVTLGGRPARGSLVRRDERLGLGLFRAAAPVTFTLSLGDVGTVKAGDTVFVASVGGKGGELVRAEVIRPDARRGARIYLALQLPKGGETGLDDTVGAPVFNREGFLLGVLLPRAGALHGLAIPANLLIEDAAGLMSEIRAPRNPTPTFASWRARIETEARQENPDVYETVESRLLLAASCDDKHCQGQVGVLAFGPLPALTAPLTFDLQAVEQVPTVREPRYGQQMVTPEPQAWIEAAPADSPLIQDTPVAARRAIVGGDIEGLRLFVTSVQLNRPRASLGQSFRIVASGFDGRRSGGTMIGAPAPPSGPAASAPPSALASAPADGPGRDTPFGDLKAGEWAERFQRARAAIEAQDKLVSQLKTQVGARQPGAEALLSREAAQLDRLRQRLATLETDADRWKLPMEFRQ